MTDNPISRRDAKEEDAVRSLKEHLKWASKIVDSWPDWKRDLLGELPKSTAALDKLPALDADGRWENATEEIDALRCKLYDEGDTCGESALHTALSILDKHHSAPPAAERRPAVERQHDEHGQPVCNHCNAKTNRAYAKFAKLQCWSCGKYFTNLTSGDAAQPGE